MILYYAYDLFFFILCCKCFVLVFVVVVSRFMFLHNVLCIIFCKRVDDESYRCALTKL